MIASKNIQIPISISISILLALKKIIQMKTSLLGGVTPREHWLLLLIVTLLSFFTLLMHYYLFRLCCLSALVYKISETLDLPCAGCLHIAVLLGDRHRSSILGVPCWPEHVHTALEIQKDLLGA